VIAAPLVTVGLPVRNGGDHLAIALAAIRAQTLVDIRIVISDNASTDGTEALCRAAAAEDDRITYRRQPTDVGVRANHAAVLDGVVTPYFVWASHDDVMEPDFVERCVKELEADLSAVLCFSRFDVIDARGRLVGDGPLPAEFAEGSAGDRLRAFWQAPRAHQQMYGIMRTEVLQSIGGLRDWFGSDRAMLLDLAVRGGFRRVDDVLFHHREHACRNGASAERYRTWMPARTTAELGYWKRARHALTLWRSPRLSLRDRVSVASACLGYAGVRAAHWLPQMGRELLAAARRTEISPGT
jgi:glycosyltransferase involved in cell wall biosynthesis